MTLASGTRLGPYDVVPPSASARCGTLSGLRGTVDREVAIKVLLERLSKDPEALARFEREAKGVAYCRALSHYNLHLHLLRLEPPASDDGLPRPACETGTYVGPAFQPVDDGLDRPSRRMERRPAGGSLTAPPPWATRGACP